MRLFIAGAALCAALLPASLAQADVLLPGSFGGVVDNGSNTDSPPVNTSFAVGQAINGSFVFDATTNMFTWFNIGGYTAAPGFTTIHSPPLASTAFAYLGVQNPVQNAAPSNDLQINFYYETIPGPSTVNLAAFVANPGPFSTDIAGGSPSYFAVTLNNGATKVDALLTSYSVTGVPEPASLLLLAPALAGLGLTRRRNASA